MGKSRKYFLAALLQRQLYKYFNHLSFFFPKLDPFCFSLFYFFFKSKKLNLLQIRRPVNLIEKSTIENRKGSHAPVPESLKGERVTRS